MWICLNYSGLLKSKSKFLRQNMYYFFFFAIRYNSLKKNHLLFKSQFYLVPSSTGWSAWDNILNPDLLENLDQDELCSTKLIKLFELAQLFSEQLKPFNWTMNYEQVAKSLIRNCTWDIPPTFDCHAWHFEIKVQLEKDV